MSDDGIKFTLDDAQHQKAMAFLYAIRAAGPKAVIRSLNTMLSTWQREIRRHIPVDLGIARASIQVRKAEQDAAGRISGAVGSNIEYLKYIEWGAERGHGLIKAIAAWKLGDALIIHWAAKDDAVEELREKARRARKDTTRLNYERRIARAESPSTEEFAPPFRGSWALISGSVIERLRNTLAKLMKEGKVEG